MMFRAEGGKFSVADDLDSLGCLRSKKYKVDKGGKKGGKKGVTHHTLSFAISNFINSFFFSYIF